MSIRIIDESELEKVLEAMPFVLLRDAAAIAKCADYEMNTADGRRYGLFCEGGEALLHLLMAKDVLVNNKDEKMLEKVRGMIVEVGSEEPPLIYEDFDSLVMAWVSLHVLHRVSVSKEEQDILISCCSEEYNKLFSDPLLKGRAGEDIDRGDDDE